MWKGETSWLSKIKWSFHAYSTTQLRVKVGKSTKSVSTFKAKGNKLQKGSGQYKAYMSLTWDEYYMKSSITM